MQKKFKDLYKKQNKIYATTSGISTSEKDIVKKLCSKRFIIEDCMTTATSYLFVYKCCFTDKYIQALKWRIPIVHVQYLYNTEDNISKYLLKPFEGASFSTLMISNDMLNNFYILQGCKFKNDIDYNTDFLITDNEGDKKDFAMQYNIPIIPCTEVFTNNYELYKRDSNIIVLKENKFCDLTFYLDKSLPQELFNLLKRTIIENDGMRVPIIDREVDYILTSPIFYDLAIEKIDKRNFDHFEDKILHYQFIIDCVENNKRIRPEAYCINKTQNRDILKNCVCSIDKSLETSKHTVINKILSLGGIVKESAKSGITHLIIKNKTEYVNNSRLKVPYKIVATEWIDQCLYNMKYMNEEKYIFRKPTLELQRAKSVPLSVRNRITHTQEEEKEIVFQFTGLSQSLREKAIEMLTKYKIKYIDSDKFENCTHLIMGLFYASEKFMCSVAKGNWILIPDFINDFNGNFNFNFENYEWKIDENTDEKHYKLIKSIKKWRERIAKTNQGAFNGWIVKFLCDDNKKPSLTTLIMSGGGLVTESDSYTYLFHSKKYANTLNGDKCLPINYLYSYLFSRDRILKGE